MPKLFCHRDHDAPPDAINIDRRSEWGNPFRIPQHGCREEVIRKHRDWLLSQPLLVARVRSALKGMDLVCHCAPLPCHGDTLLEIANNDQAT